MFSTVVLPQPEWPMTQTNSPWFIDSHRSSKIGAFVPYRRAMPSMEMKPVIRGTSRVS